MAPWERYQKKDRKPWEKYAPANSASEGQTAPVLEQGRGFLPFLNQGIASALGAPVDIVNLGLGAIGAPVSETPFLGSRSISNAMGGVGVQVAEPTAQPQTIGEYAARGLGGAAGFMLPGAGAVGLASRAASPVAQGAAQTIAAPFLSTPARALTAEALAGAGAGVGEQVGGNLSGGNPYGEVAGALIGGLAGGMGPNLAIRSARALPGVQVAESLIAGQIAPFTTAGAMSRARGRIANMTEDAALARDNLISDTVSDLSPAARTGDRRLMSLERDVRNQDAAIDRAMREQENAASQILRDGIQEIGEGQSVDRTREFLSERVRTLTAAMDERVRQAEELARERVSAFEGRQSAADASIVVREELENALSSARAQERSLWQAVPEQEVVPLTNARQAFRTFEADTPRAQRDDIPEAAKRFLGVGNDAFRASEPVKELHGLYSALRQEARNARAGDVRNLNKARIADELADALMADMQSSASASQPLQDAIAFSRQLNERFTRGSVGRVLGNERTGGERVSDIQTLDQTIGRSGRGGAAAYDEVARALAEGSPNANQAMQDYIASRFRDAAIREGEVRPGPAGTFIRSNEDLLGRMPQERQAIVEALTQSEAASRMRDTAARRSTAIERDSAASVIDRARYGEEIQAILRTQNPRATAAQLARQASRDTSGQATLGLKSAVIDDLINAARSGFDETDAPIISGRGIRARLNDNRFGGIAEEILSPEEISRVRRIADEFEKLEMARGATGTGGPIMGDQPNSIITYLARVFAARSGAAMGAGSSGASLQTASMASQRMQRLLYRLTNDKAEQLIIQAVSGDKDLFEALLMPVSQMTRQQENRIVETLGGILGESLNDIDDGRE